MPFTLRTRSIPSFEQISRTWGLKCDAVGDRDGAPARLPGEKVGSPTPRFLPWVEPAGCAVRDDPPGRGQSWISGFPIAGASKLGVLSTQWRRRRPAASRRAPLGASGPSRSRSGVQQGVTPGGRSPEADWRHVGFRVWGTVCLRGGGGRPSDGKGDRRPPVPHPPPDPDGDSGVPFRSV